MSKRKSGEHRNPEISDKELNQLAAILSMEFVQRWVLQARQRNDGRYFCIRKQLQHGDLVSHLRGINTLGMYHLNKNSEGRHLVLDADNVPDWRRLRALAMAMKDLEIPCYLESSRRGGHLWYFFGKTLDGAELRKFGQGLLLYLGLGGIELFPKLGQLAGGPGSLIRMPFGIHRKDGRRYGFCDAELRPIASTLRKQLLLLESPKTVADSAIERFSKHAPKGRNPFLPKTREMHKFGSNGHGVSLADLIKSAISVPDFVSQFVKLSETGTGLCPFHEDTVPSFSVDQYSNYWYCFAFRRGGSIIDFWMHYRDCDFRTAVEQLATMLLENYEGEETKGKPI